MAITKKSMIQTYNLLLKNMSDNEKLQQEINNRTLLGMELPVITVILLRRHQLKRNNGNKVTVDRRENDYIIQYDREKNILYGLPILLNDEYYANLDFDMVKNDLFPEIDLNEESFERPINMKMEDWPKPIEGISETSIRGDYHSFMIPTFIKDIQRDALIEVSCSDLQIPLHLLAQVARSGVNLQDDYSITITKSNNFGIDKGISESVRRNCVRFKEILKKDENIVVYRDSIAVEENGRERTLIPKFYWNRFYQSRENMIMSLLLANYKILTISNIESAILDIYYDNESVS